MIEAIEKKVSFNYHQYLHEQRPNASEDNGKVTIEENNFIEAKISWKKGFSAHFENIYMLMVKIDKTVIEEKLNKP